MDTPPYTLWTLIDALAEQPSLAPDKVKLTIPVEFVEKKRNPYFAFFDGGHFDLADQVEIENVELRTNLADEARGLLVLGVAGTCLSVEQLRARYPELAVTDHPRGRSLEEETTYSIQLPWGQLSFGFKERNPACLATVVLDRTTAPSEQPDSE